jgi:hypothetical protein
VFISAWELNFLALNFGIPESFGKDATSDLSAQSCNFAE